MESYYQISITGSENILTAVNNIQQKGVQEGVSINLLTPSLKKIRTENMCIIISAFETYGECKIWTDSFVEALSSLDVDIIRVKINTQYRKEDADKSKYIEAWINPIGDDLPMLYNTHINRMISLDRVSDKSIYDYFVKKYKNFDPELCMYDSFVENDLDWFSYYEDEEVLSDNVNN